ncbi:MAG: hypothetical protein KC621_05170 [Myxococcales bacterium]|nr:hypothetical protein [Myxococcales bacterium]
MRIVDLDGSAFERGRQQGELLREEYRGVMRDLLSSPEWRDHKPPLFPDGLVGPVLSVAGRAMTWPWGRRHVPAQAARVKGLAKGLGLSTSQTWGLQFLEVVFCEAGSSLAPPPPVGCTVVQAQPHATASGEMLTARNYDFPTMLQPYQVVRREVPTEAGRLATTTVTQVALVGAHQGVNEAGLVVSMNNARLWRGPHLRYHGVPLSLLAMELLETCRTTAEAIERVRATTARSNAGFVSLCDRSGDAAIVETTVRDLAVRRPDASGVLAQANHFTELAHANLPEGTKWTVAGMEDQEYLAGSRARQRAALDHLAKAAGEISVRTLQQVMADHDGCDAGHEATVCAHGPRGGTLSSMVIENASRTMWIAAGNPCAHPWTEVRFRGGAASEQRVAAK